MTGAIKGLAMELFNPKACLLTGFKQATQCRPVL